VCGDWHDHGIPDVFVLRNGINFRIHVAGIYADLADCRASDCHPSKPLIIAGRIMANGL
jgi:hypothetical protein